MAAQWSSKEDYDYNTNEVIEMMTLFILKCSEVMYIADNCVDVITLCAGVTK